MSLDNNSIKIDDIQFENLDSNNQSSSFSKKKIDINTTNQSDNADKDFISQEQSNKANNYEKIYHHRGTFACRNRAD